MGVQQIDDPHHPRGFRELRSNAEMRKLLTRKIVTQNRRCGEEQSARIRMSSSIQTPHASPRRKRSQPIRAGFSV